MTAYLSDDDLMQQTAWETTETDGVAGVSVVASVRESGSEQRNTPADLAEDRGAANHLSRRWLRTMMVSRRADRTADPRRSRPSGVC